MDRDFDRTFWRGYTSAANLLNLAVVVINAAYAVATWSSGPHRLALVSLNGGALVGVAFAIASGSEDRIATSPHRDLIFGLWCMVGVVGVTAGVLLDGGLASPLAWMFPLALMFAALVHRPKLVALDAAAVVVSYLAVGAVTGDLRADAPAVVVHTCYLVALGFLGTVGARARWQLHEAEADLSEQLASLAECDGLTGLLNHRAFHERLAEELCHADRTGQHVSLLVVDLDRFKTINDRHGHLVGDAVLKQVASVLVDVARTVDVVARVGGEEFCLLLPGTDPIGARVVAERLRVAVSNRVDRPTGTTVSVGVSTYPHDGTTATSLFDGADKAMYRAKDAGRNRVCSGAAVS